MAALIDLPYELIDIIFEMVPSIGLHVSKKYDRMSVAELDQYSGAKHFFLNYYRFEEYRTHEYNKIQPLPTNASKGQRRKYNKKIKHLKPDILMKPRELALKVLYGHIECPQHMYPEIKKANLLTAEDVKDELSEGNDELLDLVPEEIFEEIYDDYEFMVRDSLDNIDTLSKFYTKDALSDIYIRYMRQIFDGDIGCPDYDQEHIEYLMDYMTEYNHLLHDIVYSEAIIPVYILQKILANDPEILNIIENGPKNNVERYLMKFMQ